MTTPPKTLDYYISKITSKHIDKPKFVATVSAFIQPLVDTQNLLFKFSAETFDLDASVGVQLDAVGVRVGRNRFLDVPINVYFSLDTAGLGFDQGIIFGPGDALFGQTVLDDLHYRILLKAVVAANNWDGTVEGAYAAWSGIFANTTSDILIQDYGDDSMAIALIGQQPDAIISALFTSGELSLKPGAVKLTHMLPTVYPAAIPGGTPLFGLDAENDAIAGFDVGAIVTEFLPE